MMPLTKSKTEIDLAKDRLEEIRSSSKNDVAIDLAHQFLDQFPNKIKSHKIQYISVIGITRSKVILECILTQKINIEIAIYNYGDSCDINIFQSDPYQSLFLLFSIRLDVAMKETSRFLNLKNFR